MASVFLVPDPSKTSDPDQKSNKWVTLVAISVVALIVLVVLGLEYWMAHEGEHMGFFATVVAPLFGILKGTSMIVTNSASVVANSAAAAIGAAGRVGKIVEN